MCTYYIILYSECVLLNVHMLQAQVQVHLYTISAIYCKSVIGQNMHYRGCANC